jgi:hypothetical protein
MSSSSSFDSQELRFYSVMKQSVGRYALAILAINGASVLKNAKIINKPKASR